MIALYINDIQAKLQLNAAVTFELFSNLLDLEFISGAKSYSFTLPTLPNKNLFGSPETIANTSKELFKDYPAKIYFNGLLLYQGLFKLTAADKQSYKGNFRFDISEISAFRDKSIRDMLLDEKHTFASQDLSILNTYLDKTSNIVFPTIKVNNDTFNRYTNGLWYTENDYKDGSFMPFLKVKYILEMLIEKIGYKVENTNWTATVPDFNAVTLWNNRELDCEVNITNEISEVSDVWGIWANTYQVATVKLPKFFLLKDHVPNINLGEFINGLRKMFGILPIFNSKFKTVKLLFLKDIFADEDYLDWTAKANPFPMVENNDYQGLEFAFKRDEKDERIKPQPKEAEYTRLADVNTITQLNLTAFTDPLKAVRFVRTENKFFQKNFYPGAILAQWIELHDNILNSKIDEATTKIETPFSPVPASKILKFKGKDGKARRSPSGALWLIHKNPFLNADGYVILTKGENQKLNYPSPVTQNALTYIELSNFTPYTVDDDGVEWTRFSPTPMPILEVETPDTRPILTDGDKKRENFDFAARLFIYHGLQEQATTSFTYPYASSDIYSPKGGKVSAFGLHWEGEDGLLDYFFSKFLQIRKYGYPVSYKLRLDINDLLNLNLLRKIRIRDTDFFIKEIKVGLSEHIKEVDCVLFKIPTPVEFLIDVPLAFYKDCDVDVPLTLYKDCAIAQYQVITQVGFGGTSTKIGTYTVNENDPFNSVVSANVGYEITSISINSIPQAITNRSSMPVNFAAVNENKFIVVTCSIISTVIETVTINYSNPNGGLTNTTYFGRVTLNKGSTFSYPFVLAAGYEVISITANGQPRFIDLVEFRGDEVNILVDTDIVILTRLIASAPTNTYTVTVSTSTGGTSPQTGSTTVDAGSSFPFSFAQNVGFMLDYVRVNGVNTSIYNIDNIQANQIVEIVFKPIPASPSFTVILQTSNAGGSFSPIQGSYTVNQGASFTYALSLILEYEIDTLTLNESAVSFTEIERNGLSRLLANIQANQTLIASFREKAATTVLLTASAGSGGTISPQMSQQVPIGSTWSFVARASAGFEIDTITINGEGQTITNRGFMTIPINNITVNTNIYVTFRIVTPSYTVTLELFGGLGTANKASVTSVNQNDNYSANISPNSGYEIDRVYKYNNATGFTSATELPVNNRSLFVAESYFIQESQTFRITFRIKPIKYSGYMRYYQSEEASRPNQIGIDRTFGGSLTAALSTLSIGEQIFLEFSNAPNSAWTTQMAGQYRGLDLATDSFFISGVLTAFQAANRNQSFRLTIRNAGNFAIVFDGIW